MAGFAARITLELPAMRSVPPPIPTLGELHEPPGWFWVICGRFGFCFHKAPMAIAPLVIRWGAEVSSNRLRRCARCTVCGHKGATLQAPSWYDGATGHQPFPVVTIGPPDAV